MGLKRALKGLRKSLHLPAVTLGNVGKAAAVAGLTAATGGAGAGPALSALALSRLKSAAVGGAKQLIKTKAAKALASRVVRAHPKLAKTVNAAATTMPGGAPLAKAPSPFKRRRRAAAAAPKPAKAARKPSGGGRKPPKGGKDLKALAASWRAAGKPGKWIEWVKSH